MGCWLGLRALKTLYFYFCKVVKKLIVKNFARNYEKKIILGTAQCAVPSIIFTLGQ